MISTSSDANSYGCLGAVLPRRMAIAPLMSGSMPTSVKGPCCSVKAANCLLSAASLKTPTVFSGSALELSGPASPETGRGPACVARSSLRQTSSAPALALQ